MRTLTCLMLAAATGLAAEPIGITRKGTRIQAVTSPEDRDYATKKTRILLVGGLDGSKASAARVREALEWFETAPSSVKKRHVVSAVALASPDGVALRFPPQGDAYANDTEAHYLWRWIGLHAPDLVVEVRSGGKLEIAWEVAEDSSLAAQVSRSAPAGIGTIPALRLTAPPQGGHFDALREILRTAKFQRPSAARLELRRRVARTPLQVARELATVYGHELNDAVYIPAFALIGRLRLGEVADVERIVQPYSSGARPSLPAKVSSSHFSGHLLFGELASVTGKKRYIEMVRAAADYAFEADGTPKPAMPFHNEMSDGVFMGGPILAQAGRLTGERKYFDQSVRNMQFMLKLNLRPDGLHRHSPLHQTAWGRGNAFAALGLALSLAELPDWHPGRAEMLKAFRDHLEALLKHQDASGMWHQVVDEPASYRELSATSMIAAAMSRGVRSGWLEKARYQPSIDRAWYAVKARVASTGELVDVCTSTGKQKSLQDYLDRTAILGRDPRGGAMALLISTELARLTKGAGGRL